MSTYLWDPFAAFGRLDREFDEIVRRTWGASGRVRTVWPGFLPPADVVTEGKDIVVNIELPGVDVEKDVTVELERGQLVIRGERAQAREEEDHGVVVRERRHGAFYREFTLPDGVGADQISATYDNGILSVRLAGALALERPTRIPVAPGALRSAGTPHIESAADEVPATEGKPAR